jgi:serine/threonine protein kinase
MELVLGGTLTELLKTRKLTESEAAKVIKGILRAVAYLHSQDIVHRDLKPDNILIPASLDLSLVKVIDFGLSDESSDATYRPMTSECGTLLFVAPEQIQRKHYGKAVDVWSCGVILHMVCTGGLHPMWTEGDSAEVFRAKLGKLEWKLGEMSSLASSLFTRLTRSDPIHRYSPMQALSHPWILRKSSLIPLTSLEKIQQFNDELHLRKLLFALFFLSAASLSSNKENECWEPVKRRGRSSHPGVRLPPISRSPVKSRGRHSINGGVIKPIPVAQVKQTRPIFL